jgi:predicted PurR-regulated permease PerM
LGAPSLSILAGIGGLLLDAAVVLALAFCLATDTELSGRFISAWVPPARRSQFEALWTTILSGWRVGSGRRLALPSILR